MPDPVAIELASGHQAVRIEWPDGPLPPKSGRSTRERPWRLDGEIDWETVEALRIVTARLPDGRGLALVALRPAGAGGHGEEASGAVVVGDGTTEEVPEPLLSVESGGDGLPRRLGLELQIAGEAMPLRIAADVTEVGLERGETATRIRAELEVRLGGNRSTGTYEALTSTASR